MATEPLAAAPAPDDEPIVVSPLAPTSATLVAHPGDELAYAIAWAWREEHEAREQAEADIRSKRALIKRLQDDQDAKRKTYTKRDVIERWFRTWQQLRNHPRSKLTPERFDAARARLEEGYTEIQGAMAIHGQHARPAAKDGVVYDDFEIVFRSGGNLERYANHCPREARAELRANVVGAQLEMAPAKDDDPPGGQRVAEEPSHEISSAENGDAVT